MGSAVDFWGTPLAGSGSSLLHLAPMSAKRIMAAGPGRLSATLKMRTPVRVLSEGFKVVNLIALRLPKLQRQADIVFGQ